MYRVLYIYESILYRVSKTFRPFWVSYFYWSILLLTDIIYLFLFIWVTYRWNIYLLFSDAFIGFFIGNAINRIFGKNGEEDQTYDNLTSKLILLLENFDILIHIWSNKSTKGESYQFPWENWFSKWRILILKRENPDSENEEYWFLKWRILILKMENTDFQNGESVSIPTNCSLI